MDTAVASPAVYVRWSLNENGVPLRFSNMFLIEHASERRALDKRIEQLTAEAIPFTVTKAD